MSKEITSPTQPTIPEKQPTSTMFEPQKITTKVKPPKPKDPKRVEAGNKTSRNVKACRRTEIA